MTLPTLTLDGRTWTAHHARFGPRTGWHRRDWRLTLHGAVLVVRGDAEPIFRDWHARMYMNVGPDSVDIPLTIDGRATRDSLLRQAVRGAMYELRVARRIYDRQTATGEPA